MKTRRKGDEFILLNEYEKALQFLNGIKYKYGSSYWLLENEIFLYNKIKGDTQKEIIDKANNSILKTILSFYDMRSADEVSSRDYDYFTRREIAKFKRINPNEKHIISFYHYILYYIYTTYFDVNRRDELSYVCEDFFLYNDIEKPSLMEEFDENYSKEELIFFLRYICIPQIMGPVLLSIRSSKDLDQERINTCQYLRMWFFYAVFLREVLLMSL